MKFEIFTKNHRRVVQFAGSHLDAKIKPVFSRGKINGNCVVDVLNICFTATDEDSRSLTFEMPISDFLWKIAKACDELSEVKIDMELDLISNSSLLRPILNERKQTLSKLAREFLIDELEEAHKKLKQCTESFAAICNDWCKK